MLQFVLCAPQVHNVHGIPARSKITIDARFEIIFDDDDFADFGNATNCTQNSIAKNQKDPTVTTGNTTTLQTTPTTQLPTTTAATNNTSTTASTTAGTFQCPRFGFIADTTDCRNFYDCLDTSNPKLRTCPPPRNFDPNKSVCTVSFLC